MDYSEIAAALGRRGGKASKRPPGVLRCILMEVCDEIGSMENQAVFKYWQRYRYVALADSAPEGTCWERHSLYVDDQTHDPGKRFVGERKPKPWDDHFPANQFTYYFFDDVQQQKTTARNIRRTLHRIRGTRQRLSGTGKA